MAESFFPAHSRLGSKIAGVTSIGAEFVGRAESFVGNRLRDIIDTNPDRRNKLSMYRMMAKSNGWWLSLRCFNEFLFTFILNFMVTTSYAFFGPVFIPPVIAGTLLLAANLFAEIGYGWHGMFSVILLDVVYGNLSVMYGIGITLANMAGYFAGAGFARLVAEERYINASLNIVSPDVDVGAALLMEIIGGFFLTGLAWFIHVNGVDAISGSVAKGLALLGFQMGGLLVSGGVYDIVRWISVNGVGGSSFYFPKTWWIYPVGWIISTLVFGVLIFVWDKWGQMVRQRAEVLRKENPDYEVMASGPREE